jgi:hypothetical protein
MTGICRSICGGARQRRAGARTRAADQDERDRLLGGRGLTKERDGLLAVHGGLVRMPAPTRVQAQDVEVRFLRSTSARAGRSDAAAHVVVDHEQPEHAPWARWRQRVMRNRRRR